MWLSLGRPPEGVDGMKKSYYGSDRGQKQIRYVLLPTLLFDVCPIQTRDPVAFDLCHSLSPATNGNDDETVTRPPWNHDTK